MPGTWLPRQNVIINGEEFPTPDAIHFEDGDGTWDAEFDEATGTVKVRAPATGLSTVDDFAALRAVPSTATTARLAKGAEAVADGAEGLFFFDATATEADNAATVIKPNDVGGSPGRRKRVMNGGPIWINMAAGVKTDGTECSAAVQAAIDAAPPYGEVRFGRGTFNAKWTIANKPGLRVTGIGRETILTHAPDPAGAAWNDGIVTIETNSVGVRFRDFQIQGAAIVPELTAVTQNGNGPAVTVTGTPVAREFILIKVTTGGIVGAGKVDWSKDLGKTWEATGVTIDADVALGTTGLTAHFAAGTYELDTTYEMIGTPGGGAAPTLQCGIVVQSGSDEVEIDHVLFAGTDADHGLNACVVLNSVDDCHVHTNRITHIQGHSATDGTGYGILVAGDHNEVNGNKSDFPVGHGRHHVYVGPGALNEVHHNRVTNGWYEQIIVRATAAQAPATENRVHHNRCRNAQPLAVPAWGGVGAITVGQNAFGNEVTDNLVTDANMHGILVTDYASVVVGETPDDNTIKGNHVHRPQLMGIEVEGANGTVLDGNHIHDPGQAGGASHGIQLLNSALNAAPVRCRVINNTVATPTGATHHTSLVIWDGVTGCEVHGNALAPGLTGTFLDSGTDTVLGINTLDGKTCMTMSKGELAEAWGDEFETTDDTPHNSTILTAPTLRVGTFDVTVWASAVVPNTGDTATLCKRTVFEVAADGSLTARVDDVSVSSQYDGIPTGGLLVQTDGATPGTIRAQVTGVAATTIEWKLRGSIIRHMESPPS